jgi:hypothetical protein
MGGAVRGLTHTSHTQGPCDQTRARAVGDAQVPGEGIARLREHCGEHHRRGRPSACGSANLHWRPAAHPHGGPQVRGTPWGPATTQAPASALDVPHCLINVIGIRRRAGRLPRRKNIEGGTLHDSQVLIDCTARQRLDPLRNHRSNRLDRCSHTHAAAVGAGPLIKQSHHPLDLTTRQCRVEVRKIVKRVMLGAHSSTAFRSRT